MVFVNNQFNKDKKDMIRYCINKPNLKDKQIKKCIKESKFPFPLKKGYTIYGFSYCPYSKKAQKLLNKYKKHYIYIEVDNNSRLFRHKLHKYKGYNRKLHRTFPIIYRNDKFIGGASDLEKYLLRPRSKVCTIYGYSYCPYTKKAKDRLKSKGIKYVYHKVDGNSEYYRDMLHGFGGYDRYQYLTLPLIFKNCKFIGGSSEL